MGIDEEIKTMLTRRAGDVKENPAAWNEIVRGVRRARRVRAIGGLVAAAAAIAAVVVGVQYLRPTAVKTVTSPTPSAPTKPAPTASPPTTGAEPLQQAQLYAVDHGIVVVGGQLQYTDDGGHTWGVLSAQQGDTYVAAYAQPNGRVWAIAQSESKQFPNEIRVVDTNLQYCSARGACPAPSERSITIHTSTAQFGAYGPVSVYFSDSSHGWILLDLGGGMGVVHASQLFRTTDGGAHWNDLGNVQVTAGRIVFADANHGFIAGLPGYNLFYRSIDGGKTWLADNPQPSHPSCTRPQGTFTPPVFFDARHGLLGAAYQCAGAYRGYVLHTSDGGSTWDTSVALPGNAVFASAGDARHLFGLAGCATSGDLCYTDATKIVASSDAGQRWTELPASGASGTFAGLNFIDPLHGWATVVSRGCNGETTACTSLDATSDGGRSWHTIATATQAQPSANATSTP